MTDIVQESMAGTKVAFDLKNLEKNYQNYFYRLNRYIHGNDLENSLKVASEFNEILKKAGAVKISSFIARIKSALYQKNFKEAAFLLDEVNYECDRFFMKLSANDNQ